MVVRIALLGEVTAHVDGQQVDLGPARQQCVLAALAVDAGRLVPADRLVARVWGSDTPRRGRATLHSHISRLRKAFAGTLTIAHRSDGYTLEVDQPRQTVDLHLFRALRDQARGADVDTVALLTDALALWQGEPLTGLSGEWVERERDQWQQERRATEHDLIDAELRAGHGENLVPRLLAWTTQNPLDERVAGQYILALHRAGRSADALNHYRRLHERLVAELGTDPGIPLQDLHQQILAADPGLLPAPASTTIEPMVVPRQLPATPASFVGREEELNRLDAVLSTPEQTGAAVGGMMLISAIGGTGGIGKTWLALHWAHHHLDRFPDGQLFVDLHGFSPTEQPARPADVLGGFLDALGVDRARQPSDTDRRADLYRSLVADKRMLVVLDNAATTDQIIPLLPGGHHCTVLITSRNHLRGLVARHGAHPIRLDVLTDTDAHTLLTATLDPGRAGAEPQAITELVELCSRFPLALGLITAHATADPHLPLRDIVTELRTLGLDILDSDDPTASLPTVLSWSLNHLTNRQRTVFALLGIAPGPDTGLPAATHLTGLTKRDTRTVLRALVDASLIDRVPGGRYAMHDLVRVYATTVADDLYTDARETALRRVLDFYTHTAHTAARLLDPHRSFPPFDPPADDVHPHPVADPAAARAWFEAEHTCLLAAQHTAVNLDWHPTVWHLAWSLYTFHYRQGHRHNQLAVWQAAADAATHLSDPTTRILAHQYLGRAHTDLGHHEHALKSLHYALALAEHHHNPTQQARTHHALAWTWELQGDDHKALDHAHRALDLCRILGNPVWEAEALNGVGWYAARLGDYDTAREHCQAALNLHQEHHHPDSEAATLGSLGYIEHHTGHHAHAINHYRHALTLNRDLGHIYDTANTLDDLGHSHAALGQHEQARAVWREALQLYQEQGRHDDAARVQHQLDNLDHDGNQSPQGPETAT